MFQVSRSNGSYNITEAKQPVIQEKLFEARVYHETWNTIHFIELSDVKTDISQLVMHISQLAERCVGYPKCTMTQSIKAARTRILKMKHRINALQRAAPQRTKRGLFNFIGSGIKFLFGSMSADDAEKINNDIDEVYSKSKGITILIKNQTSLLQSTIQNLETIKDQQNTDLIKLEEIARQAVSATNALEFNNQVLNSLLELELHLEGTTEILEDLEDAVSEAKSGKISPRIIPPENFIKSLGAIQENLLVDLPFPLEENNYFLYLRISQIDIALVNGRLIYNIHTPIPSKEIYDVIKFTSLPYPYTVYGQYIYDGIYEGTIALMQDKSQYTYVSTSDCNVSGEDHFCKIQSSIKKTSEEHTCLGWLVLKKGKRCEEKYLKLQNTYVYSFFNGYQWYILPINEERVTIRCPQAIDAVVPIKNPTILTLNDHCKALTNTDIFLPATHYSKGHPVAENQISFDFSAITASFVNDSEVKLPVFHSTQIDLSQLRRSAVTLAEAETGYEELLTSRRQHSWWQTGTTTLERLGYTSLAVLIIAGFWKCGLRHVVRRLCLSTPCGKTIYKTRDHTVIYHQSAGPSAHAAYSVPTESSGSPMRNKLPNFDL